MVRILTFMALLMMITACGAPTSSFKTPDGRTVQLSNACLDHTGQKRGVGESWVCSDGCNTCWCKVFDEGPTVFQTLMACTYAPDDY